MTTITPTTTEATLATPAPSTTTNETNFSGEEFNSFLQLLTAQIQNQDPLAPLDSTQFVEQLATFSSLEQQVRSNSSLDSIAAMIGDLHSVVASEWLGSRVSVNSSSAPFIGEPIEFSFDTPAQADRAVLTVRGADGSDIWSQDLDLDASVHAWDGRTTGGDVAATDTIVDIRVDLFRGTEPIGSASPRIVTTVTDVAADGGGLRIGTKSHLTSDISDVRRLSD